MSRQDTLEAMQRFGDAPCEVEQDVVFWSEEHNSLVQATLPARKRIQGSALSYLVAELRGCK